MRRRGRWTWARRIAPFVAVLATGCGYVGAMAAGGILATRSKGRGNGAVIVAEGADLVVARGLLDAGDTTEAKGATVVATQLRFTATQDTLLDVLTVTASGTGDDADIPAVRLFLDVGGDGVVDPGDPQLGSTTTFSADDGVASFTGLDLALAGGGSVDVVVTVDLPPGAVDGDTFSVSVLTADAISATTVVTPGDVRPVPVLGLPVTGSQKVVSLTGTLRVIAGPATPASGGVFANAAGVGLLQLDLRASTAESIQVGQLTLPTSGSGDESVDVTSADLWLDADSDGAVNPAVDQPIALGVTLASNDGPLVFDTTGQTLLAGSIVRWLVRYDLAGTAANGSTFRVDLVAGGVDAVGLTSAQPITPTGPPITAGATVTVVRGSLDFAGTAANLARGVAPATGLVPAVNLVLRAGLAEAVTVTSVGIRGSGSGDEATDLAGARLVLDQDADGVADPGELVLGGPSTFGSDDGAVVFTGFSRDVGAGGAETWLVVYDLAGGARGAETFVATLSGAVDITATGRTSGLPVVATAPAVAGGTITVRGSGAIAAGPATPPAQSAFANALDVPVLQVRVTAGPGEDLRLLSLTLGPSGTGDDAADVAQVDLLHDADGSGSASAGDVLLASSTFPANDGARTLAGAPLLVVPEGSSRDLLVRYRLGGSAEHAETFAVQVLAAGLSAQGAASGLGLPVSGVAVNGAPLTAVRGQLAASAGPANPTTDVLNSAAGVPFAQVRLAAGPAEAVDVGSLRWVASGTASAQADVTAVRLYRDDDGDGVVDGAEPLLGSAPGFGGASSVTFSLAGTLVVPATSTTHALVVLDLAGTASAGETLRVDLVTLAASGATSALPVASTGLPVLGPPRRFVTGATPAPSAGNSAVSAAPTDPVADGVATSTVTITVRDQFNAPMAGRTVSLSATGGATAVTQPLGATDAAGQVTGSVASTVAGATVVTATIDPGVNQVVVTQTATVTFQAGPVSASRSIVDAAPAAILADDVSVTTITVTARDAFDNPVPGATVTLSAPGAGTFLQPAAVTDVAGETTGTFRSGTVEAKTISATAAAVAISDTAIVDLRPGVRVEQPTAVGPGAFTPGQTDVEVLALRVTRIGTGAGAATRLSGLSLRGSGTGDEASHVSFVRLWRDAGTLGVRDGADVALGLSAYFVDDGVCAFALAEPVPVGGLDLLVTYDASAAAAVGAEFAVAVRPGDVVAETDPGALAVAVLGLPRAGATHVVVAGPAVTASQRALAADPLGPDQTSAVMLRLRLDETTGTGPVALQALDVTGAGSGQDAADIRLVKLWRDVAPIGATVGAEDVLIGVTKYFVDGGVAAFAGLNETVPAGGGLDLLVTYDMADATQVSAAEDYAASVQPGDVTLSAGGAAVIAGGLPQTGPTRSVPAGSTLVVSSGLANPTGTLAARNAEIDRVMLQVAFAAGVAEDVTITQLDVKALGSGDDATGVAALTLVRDVDGDGALGGADVTIRRVTTPFSANDGTAQVGALSEPIAKGTTVSWLVVYDLAAGSTANATFSARLDAASSVVAAPAVVSGTFPITGRALSVVGGVTLSLGPQSPTGATTALPEADVEVLQVRVTADAAEAMTLSSLLVRATGSADDATAFPAARLYRDDGDGTFEPSGATPDLLLGSGAFATDDGAVTFASLAEALAASEGRSYWFAVDVAAAPPAVPGATVRAAVATDADVTVSGAVTGSTRVSGASVSGETFQTGSSGALFGVATALPLDPAVAGQRVMAIAAGDLDRDGADDYAALLEDGRVERRLGDGLGGFGGAALFPAAAPGDGVRLVLADVDRDGDLDAVVARTAAVDVHRNGGAGTFTATTTTSSAGAVFRDVAVVDFDRDGDLDVVLADDGATPRLQGLPNDGAGGLSLGATLATAAPRRLSVGDHDGDGLSDVAFSAGTDVHLARGDGVFFALEGSDAAGAQPQALLAADLDRDAYRDLIVVDQAVSADEYRVLASDAPTTPGLVVGSGPSPTSPPPLTKDAPRDLVAGDFDGDGRLDPCITHAGADDGVVVHRGDGTLSPPAAQATSYGAGTDPDRIALADFDRDGDADLLVGSSVTVTGSLRLLLGDSVTGGGGTGVTAPAVTTWTENPVRVALADFDRDGDLDYALTSKNTTRAGVWSNNGSGTVFTKVGADLVTAGTPADVVAGDVNGDGRPDLVVSMNLGATQSSRLELYPGNGDGTFGAPLVALALGTSANQVALADVDRDGDLDAVVLEENTKLVQVYRGDGARLLDAQAGDSYPTASKGRDLALADLDRDGRLDVVVVELDALSGTKTLTTRRGNGDGTFGAVATLALDAALGVVAAVAVGDVDRDGFPDIVVGSSDALVIERLRGVGDGTFVSLGTLASRTTERLLLADLDKDGDVDLVGGEGAAPGNLFTMRLADPSTFAFEAPAPRATLGVKAAGLAAGDLDRDGDVDIIVASQKQAEVFLGQ